MRYPASEKLEIIRLVEQSHLPVKTTLAVRFTDTKKHYVSEASVYLILMGKPLKAPLVRAPMASDLITSPAVVVVKAADEFHDCEGITRQRFEGMPERSARTSSGRLISPI